MSGYLSYLNTLQHSTHGHCLGDSTLLTSTSVPALGFEIQDLCVCVSLARNRTLASHRQEFYHWTINESCLSSLINEGQCKLPIQNFLISHVCLGMLCSSTIRWSAKWEHLVYCFQTCVVDMCGLVQFPPRVHLLLFWLLTWLWFLASGSIIPCNKI